MKKYLPIIAVIVLCSCNNTATDQQPVDNNVAPVSSGIAAPKDITVNIIGIYPHDTSAFTEGLQLYNGKLYEGTGDYEASALQIEDLKTGKIEKKHKMGSADIFGEGIQVFKGKIYQLTWQNHFVNVYDQNNIDKPIKTLQWPNEGWGMTNNGTDLILSDGTANLYFVNPDNFKIESTIQVVDNLGPVTQINELEYIDGFVFANVWQTDYIIKIDPSNGHVVGKISLPGLIQQYAPNQYVEGRTDVLNGIAWDSTSKKMYITGKRWPKLFEVTVNN
ncbi:MAG TPA: glutaminyl-peptide cyclotransferase [Ferruginibacter sp.]|jgi:glutamine cyclotransferase|nr:glutaminyl-peptide cyclotransferase [Ferruginibacter sp.]